MLLASGDLVGNLMALINGSLLILIDLKFGLQMFSPYVEGTALLIMAVAILSWMNSGGDGNYVTARRQHLTQNSSLLRNNL